MKLLRYGDGAVLIEVADAQAVTEVRRRLLAAADPAVTAVVPAARTVLVEFDPARTGPAQLRALLERARPEPPDRPVDQPVVPVPVHYDGADLAEVADELGLDAAAVIALHAAPVYTVLFCGFAPGFGYLTGLDSRLRVARLSSPRARVPAGSVAIADEYTGVYPTASPGGWRLLGRTDVELFSLRRDPPALLSPGTRVRFVPQ